MGIDVNLFACIPDLCKVEQSCVKVPNFCFVSSRFTKVRFDTDLFVSKVDEYCAKVTSNCWFVLMRTQCKTDFSWTCFE